MTRVSTASTTSSSIAWSKAGRAAGGGLIGRLQCDHENPTDGRDHSDDQERLAPELMRLDGGADGVQQLDHHEDEQQLVDNREQASHLRPVKDTIPRQRDGAEQRQHGGDTEQRAPIPTASQCSICSNTSAWRPRQRRAGSSLVGILRGVIKSLVRPAIIDRWGPAVPDRVAHRQQPSRCGCDGIAASCTRLRHSSERICRVLRFGQWWPDAAAELPSHLKKSG